MTHPWIVWWIVVSGSVLLTGIGTYLRVRRWHDE